MRVIVGVLQQNRRARGCTLSSWSRDCIERYPRHCGLLRLWLLVDMKIYVVLLFFLGSVRRDVRCIFLRFPSDLLDSTLMRFEARVASSLSEKRPAMDFFPVVFVVSLVFAAAMTATFLSLVFLRLSFSFTCLAFCLARIRAQRREMYNSVFDAPSFPPCATE